MEWKALIATVAPWIATAISGPLGGMAITAAADALGLTEKTESAIKQAVLGATTEQMLDLKQADQAFAARMQELGFENEQKLEALAVSDRDSARQREMSVGDRTPQILVCAVLLAWVVAQVCLFLMPIPEGNSELLSRALGTLDALLGVSFAYFFGSTAGGKLKSELLAKSTAG